MKREIFDLEREIDATDLAAAWPVAAEIAPPPLSEIEAACDMHRPLHPAPAAPDVPVAAGGLLAASYVALIAALALATVGTGHSIFMIAIAAFFVAVFFTVPVIFFGIEPGDRRRVSFDRFMSQGIDTLTGHNSGKAALVQMLIVPTLLTMGVIAMGVIVAVVG